MIESPIDSGTVDREHIEIVFDHTEEMSISLRIRTDTTDGMCLIGHTMTSRTLPYILMEIRKRLREILHIRWMCFQ